MKEITIKAKKRKNAGKSYTKKIRKQGYTPAIIYGIEEPLMCELKTKELKDLIYTDKVYIVNLDFDGELIKCIKKDEQFHPVTDDLLHLDFMRVSDEHKTTMYLPVNLVGFAEGVKQGGFLYKLKRYVKVRGFISKFPDNIELDITSLTLGKSLKISDLDLDDIEILEHPSAVIAMVKLTRTTIDAPEEEEEEEEAVEGEEEAAEGEEGAEEKTDEQDKKE